MAPVLIATEDDDKRWAAIPAASSYSSSGFTGAKSFARYPEFSKRPSIVGYMELLARMM